MFPSAGVWSIQSKRSMVGSTCGCDWGPSSPVHHNWLNGGTLTPAPISASLHLNAPGHISCSRRRIRASVRTRNHEAIVEARAAAIAALGTNPYFEASTLVQVLRVETAAGLPVEPGADLSVGDQINITFRVDTPASAVDDRSLVVESIPPGAVTVDEVPSPLTDGDHIISATVRLPGQNLLRFNVTPDALLSSRPVVSLPTLASSSIEAPDGDRAVATSPGDSLQLINWLDREVELAASQWRGAVRRRSSSSDFI